MRERCGRAARGGKREDGMVILGAMKMATFALNLLRVLDTLLHEGSTVAAGRRVGLSQSAVSAALGRLRDALGDPLFVRRGPRLEATDFARGLADPLREHLAGIERLLSGPGGFDPGTAERSFALAGVDFFGELLMPPLGRLLLDEAPRVRVHLIDLTPRACFEAVEKEVVDLVLCPQTERPDWVDWQGLFRSPFAMIAREGHPRLAGIGPGEPAPLDLFCDLDHVLMSPDGRPRAQMDEALALSGRSRRVVMTLPFLGAVCRCAAGSDFVAMVPRQLAQHVARMLGLAVRPPPMPMPVPVIGMGWHRRATSSPAHAWLRGTVARLLEPLDEGGAPPPA